MVSAYGRSSVGLVTSTQAQQHIPVRCDAGRKAMSSNGARPQPELLIPVSQLVEARVIYCAAPAMGHNQVYIILNIILHAFEHIMTGAF